MAPASNTCTTWNQTDLSLASACSLLIVGVTQKRSRRAQSSSTAGLPRRKLQQHVDITFDIAICAAGAIGYGVAVAIVCGVVVIANVIDVVLVRAGLRAFLVGSGVDPARCSCSVLLLRARRWSCV